MSRRATPRRTGGLWRAKLLAGDTAAEILRLAGAAGAPALETFLTLPHTVPSQCLMHPLRNVRGGLTITAGEDLRDRGR
jgi:hypothetical protein